MPNLLEEAKVYMYHLWRLPKMPGWLLRAKAWALNVQAWRTVLQSSFFYAECSAGRHAEPIWSFGFLQFLSMLACVMRCWLLLCFYSKNCDYKKLSCMWVCGSMSLSCFQVWNGVPTPAGWMAVICFTTLWFLYVTVCCYMPYMPLLLHMVQVDLIVCLAPPVCWLPGSSWVQIGWL